MTDQQQSSFAEIAVEFSVARSTGDVDLAELAWASWAQAIFAGDRAVKVDVLAARIGLAPDITTRVLAAERTHTRRIAEAHALFKELIPYEAEVRAILARARAEPEAALWSRLRAQLLEFICRRKPRR